MLHVIPELGKSQQMFMGYPATFMNKICMTFIVPIFTLYHSPTSIIQLLSNYLLLTVPSKPGAITVMALSNVSISLSLGRPVDMGVTQYNFSIIYGSASSSDVSFNEITNSTKIQDLQSGTNYTISVTTVVQDGVKSEAVVLNQFTSKCEAFSRVCNGADHRPEARKKESRSSFRSLDLGDRVCFDCDLQKD